MHEMQYVGRLRLRSVNLLDRCCLIKEISARAHAASELRGKLRGKCKYLSVGNTAGAVSHHAATCVNYFHIKYKHKEFSTFALIYQSIHIVIEN